jgi:hypothetical protein
MRYRDPLTPEQLAHARNELRKYRTYKNLIEKQFPPRTIAQAEFWRQALEAVRQFKHDIVAQDAEGMNRASELANTLLVEYVNERISGRT